MRTDKVSIQQAREMMQIYYKSSYNLDKVIEQFKHKRDEKSIVLSLKQSIKTLLIEIQGEIFIARVIQNLRIYDSIYTTQIMEGIHNLKQILSKENNGDFWTYYIYKCQFIIRYKHQIIQVPVEPITTKKKQNIYEAFIDYFQRKKLFNSTIRKFQAKGIQLKHQNSSQKAYENIYNTEQLQKIYEIYASSNGQIESLCFRLRRYGFSPEKYEKSNIKQTLIHYLALGLGKVYKISNNLDQFAGCSIEKFKKLHIRIMKTLTLEEKKVVLKISMFNSFQDRDILNICNKIGIRYRPAGFPRYTREFIHSQSKRYRDLKQKAQKRIMEELENIIQNGDYSLVQQKDIQMEDESHKLNGFQEMDK